MANLFKSLGNPDKIKELLDATNRGAQVEIAPPTEQPVGVEAMTPRPMAQVPARPEVERELDLFRTLAPQPTAPPPARSPQDEQMMASLPNTLEAPQMARKPQYQRYSSGVPVMPAGASLDDPVLDENGLPITVNAVGGGTRAQTWRAMDAAQKYLEQFDRENGPQSQGRSARSSSQIYDEIQGLDNYEDPHKHSLLARLFKGMGKSWKQWDPKSGGGILGLATSMIADGIGSAASPEHYGNLERNDRENKLFRSLGVARDREDYEGKQAQMQAQRENLYNQVATRTANTQSQILDRNSDNIREDEKVRQAANKKTVVKYNGKYFNRMPDGSETPLIGEDGQQRTELKDVPIATTLSDGTPIFTTGDKAMDREITQNLNQTRMDFEAKKLNQADLDRYEQETVEWAEKEAERKQEVSKLIFDGQALQNQAAQYEQQAQGLSVIDADQKAELLAKAARAREEGNSLVKQGNKLQNIPTPKPKKPAANLTAPNLKVGTYSEADFTARAKARGIDGPQLAAAIAQARKDGVIK